MREFTNVEELKSILLERWSELADIKNAYLSDAGKAAMEAYRVIYWHLSFHDKLETLLDDEQFNSLVSIPDKHPEYYKIIRMFNRALEKKLNS